MQQQQQQGQQEDEDDSVSEEELTKLIQKFPNWTSFECSRWVRSLGEAYRGHSENFLKHGIDGEMLKSIEIQELQEIEVTLGIHKKKILMERDKLIQIKSASDSNQITQAQAQLQAQQQQSQQAPLPPPSSQQQQQQQQQPSSFQPGATSATSATGGSA